jgi:hypothetical protein
MMEYYEITCDKNTFTACIIDDNDLYRVYYGGSKSCVSFSVYKDEDGEYPNMDSLGSSPKCNVQGNLEGKEGTVILVKSCLKFMLWRFPMTKHIQFIDSSTKKCANKVRIDLATFHFAKYGKTWYQDRPETLLHNSQSHLIN